MKIIADYHTHTKYSHGKGSIEDNVKSAIIKGLDVVAISDHSISYKEFGIAKTDYKLMRDEVNRLKEKYYGEIDILLGLEANILDESGNIDIDEQMLKYNDILLVGFHFDIVYEEKIKSIRQKMSRRQNIKRLIDYDLYEEITNINTIALTKAMKIYDIDIITHPGDKYPIDITQIAKIASDTNTALEINNFHKHLGVSQINKAIEFKKVKFVVSSDAHRPKDVGNFSQAINTIKKAELDLKKIINVR